MDNFELIERYLLDRMEDDEKARFESMLESDPELRSEKETMATLILGVASHGLRSKLQGRKIGVQKIGDDSSGNNLDSDYEAEIKTVKTVPLWKKMAVAASFAGLIICGWWVMQNDAGTEDLLFADVFYQDPGLPTPMSETKNYNFYDAMVDYKNGKYQLANDKWQKVTEGIGTDTLKYYIGIAQLNMDNIDEAINSMNDIPQNSAMKNRADWQMLGYYIKKKNYSEAKIVIKKIPSNYNPKYEEVRRFLESK